MSFPIMTSMQAVARRALLLSLAALLPTAARAQLAIRADTVMTMSGAPIADGVVIVGANGKIERVGPAASTQVPNGYRQLTAKVVTPGFIDARAYLGLSGALNVDWDQDQLDRTNPIQPELRAIDAYNARETLVAYVRQFGVTTIHTGHGPGALVPGQTMIVKTAGETVDQAVVDTMTMVAAMLDPSVSQTFTPRAPGTRAKQVAMLRDHFVKAQDYARKAKGGNPPARDLALETTARVLAGEKPLLLQAHSTPAILAALRLQKEFGFRMILDGAADAHLLVNEIKAAGVAVIVHPPMQHLSNSMENASVETAGILAKAGIPIALQSGFEGYAPKTRVVPLEAQVAARSGLGRDGALRAITIDAARLLGVERRIGSLEAGKDADLVLWDGDPMEILTHACAVVVNGKVVNEGCR